MIIPVARIARGAREVSVLPNSGHRSGSACSVGQSWRCARAVRADYCRFRVQRL